MKDPVTRYSNLVIAALAATLAACGADDPGVEQNAEAAAPPAIAARLATQTTFRHAANDSALWLDAQQPGNSLLLVSGGEGGLEIDDLSGKRVARFESLEAGFVDIRQNVASAGGTVDLVIASDQGRGAVRIYALDAPARRITELTAAPIAVDDAITGVCTYHSSLTDKLYAFVATDQGQLEQWELFLRDGKALGQFVRRIAAGKGVAHCVADDVTGEVYFSEERTTDVAPFMPKYWFGKLPWEDPDAYWKRSPLSLVGAVKTPTLVLVGDQDFRTPLSDSEQYYQALQLAGVPTGLIKVPGASHGGLTARPSQSAAKASAILAWFERYRGKEPAKAAPTL